MTRTFPKRLTWAMGTVFVLLLVSLVLLADSLLDGKFGGVFRTGGTNVKVWVDGEDMPWQETALSLQGEKSLVIQNGEKGDVTVCFFSDGKTLFEISVPEGEKAEVKKEFSASAVSVSVKGENVNRAHLLAADLVPVSEFLNGGGDLFFYKDQKISAVTLYKPYRMFGGFSFEELSFDTENDGKIVISPTENFVGKLYVQGENCNVYSRNFQLDACEGCTDFYIKAKSYNEKKLQTKQFPITSSDELNRLASSEALPRLCEDAVITVKQAFSLTQSLEFDQHVALHFENAVDFETHTLSFYQGEEGTFSVTDRLGTCPPPTALLFYAPRSSLTWTNEDGLGAVPVCETVEKYSNIKEYNALATTLGGEGTAEAELVFYASDNEFLLEDMIFRTKGNLLVGTLPYEVSASQLNGAVYRMTSSEGSVYLEGEISTGRMVTVDEKGREKRFALSVEREKKGIPVLYIETEDEKEITTKSQYISATFRLDGENTSISSVSETHIRIRGRGNSTWKWDKKPYKIHFDEATSILGLPAAEEWALFANYADKSLMRNRLAQVMASELSFEYSPTQEYVDLFLNGEYLGVYTIGEHLEAGEGRVEVQHDMSQKDCGYFLEAGGVVGGVDVKGMNYFHAGLVKFVLIKEPQYNTLTSEQFSFIQEYMLEADRAVKAGEGYEEYLDMESVVDWLIMIELANNTDCAWRRSTYFTKDPGGKLVMGPVWDFDLAFGNFSKDVKGFDTWVSTSDDDYVGETWSTHLLQDPEFQALFKERWLSVRDRLLEVAMESIESDYKLLKDSADENFRRWDILGKKVAFERHDTKNYKTYESQIEYLKNFLKNRASWIDSQVEAW